MAKLTGSEKQVAWAEDIRAKMAGLFKAERDRDVAKAEERFADDAERLAKLVARHDGILEDRMAALDEIKTARWFIDWRDAVDFDFDLDDAGILAAQARKIARGLEQEATMQGIRGI